MQAQSFGPWQEDVLALTPPPPLPDELFLRVCLLNISVLELLVLRVAKAV